jgi:DNA primase
MKRIKQEVIDRIREQVSIIDVIENYTRVVKKGYGNAYMGFCPFHNDVTNPSMSIDADKKVFHCFTCEEGGDLFQFIQKQENVGFADSVRLLAERYGIPVEYDNPDDTGNEEEKVSYFKLLKDAEDYFIAQLDKSEVAKKYLEDRHFSAEIIEKWGLGWAPGNRDLYNHLLKLGYKKENMVEAGVVSFNENRKDYQDVFFSRVIFPIRDVLSRPIGFGGRTLDKDGKPKYLNSKENPVFHKRQTLFGLNMARKEIQKRDEVIVTEGYVDTIMLHQYGVTNTVAALGTAFTAEHVLVLSRLTKNIYLCLDADKAGRDAARRGIDLLTDSDANVYVIEIPLSMAKDPDEFLQKYPVEDFVKIKSNAISIQKFIIKSILEEHDLTSANTRDRAYNAVMDFLREYKNTFTMFQGIDACDYIVGRLDIPVSGHNLYSSIFKDSAASGGASFMPSTNKIIDTSLEFNLLRLLLDWPSLVYLFHEGLKPEFFSSEENHEIYDVLLKAIDDDINLNQIKFPRPDLEKIWNRFLVTHPSANLNDKQAEQAIKRTLNSMRRTYLENQLEELSRDGDANLDEIFRLKMELSKVPLTF